MLTWLYLAESGQTYVILRRDIRFCVNQQNIRLSGTSLEMISANMGARQQHPLYERWQHTAAATHS